MNLQALRRWMEENGWLYVASLKRSAIYAYVKTGRTYRIPLSEWASDYDRCYEEVKMLSIDLPPEAA